MSRTRPDVLVLHNAPAAEGLRPGAPCRESDAGVLEQVENVTAALAKLGVRHRVAAVRALADVTAAVAAAPELLVFNLVEALAGPPDDVSRVPSVCRAHGKGWTGGDTVCVALTLDKWRTKAVLRAAGVPVPGAILVPVGCPVPSRGLPRGPLIVKPVAADASEGIDTHSVVAKPGATLRRLVLDVHERFGQSALVEEFVAGRELNVSLWERDGRVQVLPIAEMDFSIYGAEQPHVVGYRAKWVPDAPEYDGLERILPAKLPARLAAEVRRVALMAWAATGCLDYARVDLRLTRRGQARVIEVNVNPDISPDAGFPAALKAGRIRFPTFVRALLDNAERRRAAWAAAPAAAPTRPAVAAGVRAPAPPIRTAQAADRDAVLALLADTRFFRPDELEVAAEVFDDALADGPDGHYQSFVAVDADGVAGWISLGPTPCSLGAWDIYWLGVAPGRQGRGVGKALVRHGEEFIRARGGYLSVIETSGSPGYVSTRGFYLGLGYEEAARLRDFYALGDDRIIYTRRLDT